MKRSLAFSTASRLFLPLLGAAVLLSPAPAAAQTKPAASKADTTKTTRPAAKSTISESVLAPVERDLRVFGEWVNDKVERADATIRRELPQVKADFERQSQRIDRAADSLSNQSKREYGYLKSRYKSWEAEQAQRESQARQPATAQQAQVRFLGENVNIARARPAELHDLYGRFIDYSRENRKQWTPDDWAQASTVLSKLNQRYEQVREQIELDERLRIRSWQAEFRTFEKARGTKDALNK
ncbi:hypothetical protein [Hymenobacter sp. B81]|uniref:hypothetical protein n=1 Tax=Hymenobacter sp. B81 TaxID=3344878 RepID=UPI0037DC4D75